MFYLEYIGLFGMLGFMKDWYIMLLVFLIRLYCMLGSEFNLGIIFLSVKKFVCEVFGDGNEFKLVIIFRFILFLMM